MYRDFLNIPFSYSWWILPLFVWVLFWKGLALWKAARLNAKWWYVAILLINTAGILEILYIYFFSNKKLVHKLEEKVKALLTKANMIDPEPPSNTSA